LKILFAGLQVHKYEYAAIRLSDNKIKTVLPGFETLSSKSIRIMNRFARLMTQYHEANKHK